MAMNLVSGAENSSLDWKAPYKYIEDIDDGLGCTVGIVGCCSGTGDKLDRVRLCARRKPGNLLARRLLTLEDVNGTDSPAGLDPKLPKGRATGARGSAFQRPRRTTASGSTSIPLSLMQKQKVRARSCSARHTTASSTNAPA
ncbi:chitosanase [Streptomyces sp. NPDC004111]|uniref:chitosanase n=1 Tax=Streptomyces sp. NPDC004111 TaxID=3364690 RepID=UPI0036A6F196